MLRTTIHNVPVTKLVDQIMGRYDDNRNNAIDMVCPKPKAQKQGWRARFMESGKPVLELNHSQRTGGARSRRTEVFTYRDLFVAADRNKDGRVTRQELTQKISESDINKDGHLSWRSYGLFDFKSHPKLELDLFNDAWGERYATPADMLHDRCKPAK